MQLSNAQLGLRSGTVVFILILLTFFAKAGSGTLLTICVAPGLVYGGALLAYGNKRGLLRSALFLLLSMGINFFCAYYVTQDFLEPDKFIGLKLITAGTVSAVAISISYDLLIADRFSLLYTIAMPAIAGIASSLISAICIYFLTNDKNYHSDFATGRLFVGSVAVFPLWQYALGLTIDYHNFFSSKPSR
jgi:hypothetical protein